MTTSLKQDQVFVLAEPDFGVSSGHPHQMVNALAAVCQRRATPFSVLANQSAGADSLAEGGLVLPVFRERISSWEKQGPTPSQISTVIEDWGNALITLRKHFPAQKLSIFFYGGHPALAQGFRDVAERSGDKDIQVTFNLFAPYLLEGEFKDLSSLGLVPGPNSPSAWEVTTDCPKGLGEGGTNRDAGIRILPFFSLLDPFIDQRETRKQLPSPECIHVFYPSYASFGRGIDVLLRAARRSVSGENSFRPEFHIRFGVTRQRARTLSWKIRWLRFGVRPPHRIIYDSLETPDLIRLWSGFDVTVIPYRLSEFAERTSAVAADSIALGLPFVAARGTWMGGLIEAYGCGETFCDGDPEDLLDALKRLRDAYPEKMEGVDRARKMWLKNNNLNQLIYFCQDKDEPATS